MSTKIFKASCLVAAGLLAQQASAAPTFAEAVQEMGSQAVKGYMQPFATGLGVGMNSQWAYSSKAQSFLGLPVGASVYIGYPVVLVNDKMKTFSFEGTIPTASLIDQFGLPGGVSLDSLANFVGDLTGKDYDSLTTLRINIKDVPTIYGSNKARLVTLDSILAGSDLLTLVKDYDSLAAEMNPALAIAGQDTLQLLGKSLGDTIALPFRGFNLPIAPTLPPIGVNLAFTKIPVLDNITIGARYVPTLSNKKLGSVGMLGYTVQHEITNHIPVLGSMPFLHFGLLYGYNGFDIEVKDVLKIESRNQVYMFTASVDVKFLVGLGVYGGIGYEKSELTIEVEEQDYPEYGITSPSFDASIQGDNKLRSQLGARFSFATFDVYGDVSFGSTTTYNGGLAIGLNGL